MALEQSGETTILAGDPGKGEDPAGADILVLLVDGLREQRDGLRAVAVVCDVRQAESDVVRVEPEHQEGIALAALLPCHRLRLRRGIAFGDLALGLSSPKVWQL